MDAGVLGVCLAGKLEPPSDFTLVDHVSHIDFDRSSDKLLFELEVSKLNYTLLLRPVASFVILVKRRITCKCGVDCDFAVERTQFKLLSFVLLRTALENQLTVKRLDNVCLDLVYIESNRTGCFVLAKTRKELCHILINIF